MNEKQNKTLIFSTDNFCLAVVLKGKGCNLLQINKENPRHSFFHFEDNSKRQRLTEKFWKGKSTVEPRAFYAAQRELKTLLYDKSYPPA